MASPRQTQTGDKTRKAGNTARASRNNTTENKQHRGLGTQESALQGEEEGEGRKETEEPGCRGKRERNGQKRERWGLEAQHRSREESRKQKGRQGKEGGKTKREEIEEGRGKEGEYEGREGPQPAPRAARHLVPHEHPASHRHN